jgi:hypothetical protein
MKYADGRGHFNECALCTKSTQVQASQRFEHFRSQPRQKLAWSKNDYLIKALPRTVFRGRH